MGYNYFGEFLQSHRLEKLTQDFMVFYVREHACVKNDPACQLTNAGNIYFKKPNIYFKRIWKTLSTNFTNLSLKMINFHT